ncbi:MAG: hypothetical protein M3142_03825 [Bacteroidota bacterium]|nr:hypothetical protein [Bacteroidota bacterium]
MGWNFLPNDDKEQETNCYRIAKALANQVNLSLILPKVDPDLILENVNLTGLNNVDFEVIFSERNSPKVQPFAEADYIRAEIPLYGSPNVPENQRSYSKARVKTLVPSKENLAVPNNNSDLSQEVIDSFNQINWDSISIDSKIIHYARFATRNAANHPFDVIFASNWLTYLAGYELQLITGKPLAIQLNTLSQDHRELNNQGWRYELEKMVIERSKYLFTSNPLIAESIKAAYPLSSNSVICLEGSKSLKRAHLENTSGNNNWQNKGEHLDMNTLDIDWEIQSNKIVQVLTKSFSTVN